MGNARLCSSSAIAELFGFDVDSSEDMSERDIENPRRQPTCLLQLQSRAQLHCTDGAEFGGRRRAIPCLNGCALQSTWRMLDERACASKTARKRHARFGRRSGDISQLVGSQHSQHPDSNRGPTDYKSAGAFGLLKMLFALSANPRFRTLA